MRKYITKELYIRSLTLLSFVAFGSLITMVLFNSDMSYQ